jgi:hypothetical protein
MELTNNIKKRFVKDFRLPINLIQEPYFSYFIELYNPIYKTEEKLNMLNHLLKKYQNEEDFFNQNKEITTNIKNIILSSQSYKNFNNIHLEEFPLKNNISHKNIYIEENMNQDLISIDLKQANFNIFRLFGLQKELNIKNYEELVSIFSKEKYFSESKMIRQIIFGELNPSRQQRLQKYVIQNLSEKLLQNGCQIFSASSDEIIIKNESNIDKIKHILNNVDEKFHFFRIEKFSFEKIDQEHDFYLKKITDENGNNKVEFKNVPSYFFAQVYKKAFQLEVQEYDLMFYYEGLLAKFQENLFQNNLKKSIDSKRKL